ncbi:MAG: hydrogenase maturation nickel metallochaperone HypA [Spirulinaceae cyanobacterium RM2_2_10]|nr:hydrogenase maturation nickel metallochaperone HypA [Spirulinaceae cyanobacterium SM2_1_0]NJO20987.1 hydrogenase maturation nickel metallochaperone HypA [Spirulinaceae cyanobacterium RM2_2_10]
MHEVSLMAQTLELAIAQVHTQQANRIHRLKMRIGELSGVVPEALAFAFEVAIPGTLAAGAVLELETVPARCHCRACERDFQPTDWFYECPHCGQLSSQILAGKEIELTSLEVS